METIDSYEQGIVRAQADGYIQPCPSRSDDYSHIERVYDYNSRFLHPAARKVLQAWRGYVSNILEIGPGAGIGAAGLKRLAPESTLHTAGGITPINPFWKPSRAIIFEKEKREEAASDAIRRLLKGTPAELDEKTYLSPDQIMKIQRQYGIEIFDVVEKPYIDYQFTDDFSTTCKTVLQKGAYDFVYESCGPNWHLHRPELAMQTYSLVSPQGVLCMNSGSPIYHEDHLQTPFVVPVGYHTLTINSGNFLAPYVEERQRELGRKLKIDEMNALLGSLIGIKTAPPRIGFEN